MSEKWWDMSDDKLDDLFREASDKVDIPFDSSAYNKLRQKTAERPTSESLKGFKRRWLFITAGLFLMVGLGLLVYRFGNDPKGNDSTQLARNIGDKNITQPSNVPFSVSSEMNQHKYLELLRSVNSTSKEKVSSVQKENIGAKSKPTLSVPFDLKEKDYSEESLMKRQGTKKVNLQSVDTKIETNLINSQILNNSQQSAVKTIGIQRQTTTKGNMERSERRSQIINLLPQATTASTNLEGKEKSAKRNKNVYYNSKYAENQLVEKNNSKSRKDRNSTLNPVIIEQNTSPVIKNSTIFQDKIVSEEIINRTNFYNIDFLKNKNSKTLFTNISPELPDYVDSLPRTIKPVKFSRLGLRLVLSPDINSIENMKKMVLGGSIGLLLEYKVSKKLTLQTGIVYSSKGYVGSFDDYHNWKDWKGYHPSKPTEIDGGCKIFDIPINLRLDLLQKPKQTWFVSSGISSYWIINEKYTYNYDWYPSRAVNWSDNSKYYFGVLNFSVGLERQISHHFSFQIEPYLKAPLKYVGRGGVNLYSSGILFSTKYEF
jgi:hypothetical protein